MTKENHYADSHPEKKPNGVPHHKPGKKGSNQEASYKQDDPDSHNDICKHKDPNPDDPSNPEEAPTPNSFNSKLWWEASYAKREQTLLCP
ncbi:hypothetical protein F2Y46_23085 [Bacteroides caccae]|jgi:hypothetical protein|nr:hypothetical protein F2Y30_23105 [Bacteroides caccae]KAA2346941.1 hypothetical protein F2Y46_23085 [Bacteroides caccae]KAA2349560.1 hypothetical protein F2Y24_23055 [Bacteroides caccae]KAA2355124.1 hypothetical protein F2Y40_22895 [Bacteroides caccae]KAA5505982.1 hypothetical protein F2Y41_23235 [Bacteroides caccae]